MTNKKIEREIAQFKDFAGVLGLTIGDVTDANAAGPETGMDVATTLGGRSIGVQITDYHADEDQTNGSRGQTLRSEEEKKAREALKQDGVKSYGSWAPGNYIPPLRYRLASKIAKASKYSVVKDELWLLVTAQDQRFGATGSTFIAAGVVSIETLNRELNEHLAASPFTRVFLFLASERAVYGWTKAANRWECLKEKPELDQEHVREMQELLFGRGKVRDAWLTDPEGMSEKAIAEILDPKEKA
jgi:hypothetical protein